MKNDIKRVNKILSEYRDNLLREMDSLDNVIECSLGNYDFMIDFAIKEGYKTVVDIGCAYGHQAELCRNRIRYIGIDEDNVDFYGDSIYPFEDTQIGYIVQKYPHKILEGGFKDCLAISNLAIGWNCYVDEKEFDKQCKALKNDFVASLLYLPKDREKILKENFKEVKTIKDDGDRLVSTAFYYCK